MSIPSTSTIPSTSFNSLHLSLTGLSSQFCSQCKVLLPSTSFPIRITNLSLMPVCKSHSWYYGEGNRSLGLSPDNVSNMIELEAGMRELVKNKDGEGRWICEGSVEDDGVSKIMRGGTLDSEQLRPPRSRKKEGPQGTLYRLSPTLSQPGTQYNLNVYLHPLQSKTIFVVRELDQKGKEIKIQVEKPPKRSRGKAKKGIWLNPGDEGVADDSTVAVGIVAVSGGASVAKKLRTLPGKGKGVKRLVEVENPSSLPPLPLLALPSLQSTCSTFNPVASTSKQRYVDQLDMLASVLDAATKDTDIMIPRRKRPLSHLPPAYNSSHQSDQVRSNPLPKRRIALTHHPLARPAPINNSIFHPVAITSSPTRSPTRRSSTALNNNNQNNGPFISPTRANHNNNTLLSIQQNPSNDHLQPLSLADLLASPFLGSPPLPIRKQPLSFLSQVQLSQPHPNGSLPLAPPPASTTSFLLKSPRKLIHSFLPHSPSRLYKSTTPHTSPSKNTRSSTSFNRDRDQIGPINSPTPNSNPSSSYSTESGSASISASVSAVELEDIVLHSEGEFSEEEFSEEEDEGDWLTGFVKGQLGSRYLGPGEEDEEDYKSDVDIEDEGGEGEVSDSDDADVEGESEDASGEEEEEEL